MKRFLGAALVIGFAACQGTPARADEQEAMAVIDKAIKAAGSEELEHPSHMLAGEPHTLERHEERFFPVASFLQIAIESLAGVWGDEDLAGADLAFALDVPEALAVVLGAAQGE